MKKIVFFSIAIIFIGMLAWFAKTEQFGLLFDAFGTEKSGGAVTLSKENPFEHVVIPDIDDTATRARFEETVQKTREQFQELPEAWETWIAIGNMYTMLGDHYRAIAAFKISGELHNNILSNRNIAETYRVQLKDYESASIYYRAAIDEAFQDAGLYVTYAQLLQNKLDNPDKAENVLLNGLNRIPKHPDILVALVQLYEKTGNREKHRKTVELLLKTHPDNELYRQQWGSVLDE